MKQLFFVLFLSTMFASFASAQDCVISGPSSLTVGETGVYSIPQLGQCWNCYDWDVEPVSGIVSFVGVDTKKSVTISADAPGSFTIKVTYFDENGCHECFITGTCSPIEDPCPQITSIQEVNEDCSSDVAFYAMFDLPDGYNVIGANWSINPDNPTSLVAPPSFGNAQTLVQLDCGSGAEVNAMAVTVYLENPTTGETCTLEFTENWNIPVCGSHNTKGCNGGGFSGFRVGPNPVRQQLNIQFEEIELGTEVELSLYDYNGRQVKNKITTSDTVINTEGLNDGVYILKAETADGIIETQKIYISK